MSLQTASDLSDAIFSVATVSSACHIPHFGTCTATFTLHRQCFQMCTHVNALFDNCIFGCFFFPALLGRNFVLKIIIRFVPLSHLQLVQPPKHTTYFDIPVVFKIMGADVGTADFFNKFCKTQNYINRNINQFANRVSHYNNQNHCSQVSFPSTAVFCMNHCAVRYARGRTGDIKQLRMTGSNKNPTGIKAFWRDGETRLHF
ncbi:Hypothetical_protein [Hexamita inflata]|uniref:Hypothetical_protein n=2 Tax=Hexamita inflata TaxID=28002 RepID=A0AA86PEA9_9EUKA|nr:Hypothetical protein HINF_LOCUS25189 [Hexamita inflata]